MAGFFGEFECKLDAKFRLALPATFKKQMPPEANGQFIINRGYEKYLVLYPLNEWEIIMAELNRLNLYVKKNREFIRYFRGGATELTLDNNNRLLLPKRLLSYADIKEDILLVGYEKYIEMWDLTLHDSAVSNESGVYNKLAEEIMGNAATQQDDNVSDLPEFPPTPPGQPH